MNDASVSETATTTVTLACPNCAAAYAVPRAKLGANGRTLKCAQCGTRWHAVVPTEEVPTITPAATLAAADVDWETPRSEAEAAGLAEQPAVVPDEPAAPVAEDAAAAATPEVSEVATPVALEALTQVAKTAEMRRQQAPLLRILQDTWAPTLAWALGIGGVVAGAWVWQGEVDKQVEPSTDAAAEVAQTTTQRASQKVGQKALTASMVSKTAHAGLVLANVSATLVTGPDDTPVLEVFGEIVNAGPGAVTPPPVRLDGLDAKGDVLDLALTSSSMLLAPGEVQPWRLQLPPVNMTELAGWRVLWATTAGTAGPTEE
jgi:predicted Zn finger-like uncharacterized protein